MRELSSLSPEPLTFSLVSHTSHSLSSHLSLVGVVCEAALSLALQLLTMTGLPGLALLPRFLGLPVRPLPRLWCVRARVWVRVWVTVGRSFS